MSKSRDLANLGSNTAAIATDVEVANAVAPKADAANGTLTYPTLKSPQEVATVSATAATGTINFDVKTQAVLYYTVSASTNFTVNVRGDSGTTLNSLMDVADTVTVVFMNTNGATAYYASGFQIDGNAVTPKWAGGTAPSAGNANAIDAYSFTIVKTAATPTYVVLAGQTKLA